MTAETRVKPDAETPAPKPFLRDRTTEEPRGRWDNRCEFVRHYGQGLVMACDRRFDHRGLHHGRLFTDMGWSANARVIGWVTVIR